MTENSFHAVDYAIFATVLFISLSIGLYHAFTGGKQRTTKEFLMGNRQMQTFPVALSILVSFVSGILVLGTPAEMYTRGTQLFMRTVGYCIACLLSSLLFVPLFFNLKVTSSFEYLERRFKSQVVKLIGTVSMLIGNLFYMGIVIYTPATALEAVTGFPLWSSIIVSGIVTTIYTALGMVTVGGIERVWNISQEGGRIVFFNFDFDPTQRLTFWSTVIGGTFSTLGIFGIGQTSVQRYCSLPTLRQAQRSVYLNIPFLIIVNVLMSLVGLVIYAYYADIGCDPLRNKDIRSSNQLVPYFIVNVVGYPGLPGIFLAVLFSGSLSSLSSSLNSAATVTWQDILNRFGRKFSEAKKTLVTKALVVVYGILAVAVAYVTSFIGGNVLQASLSFSGATIGPSLGMFLLGALFPFANVWGALVGCILSSVFSLWLAIGTFIMNPHEATLRTSIDGCNRTNYSSMSLWNDSMDDSTASIWTQPLTSSWDFLTHPSSTAESSSPLSFWDVVFVTNPMYKLSFLWYSMTGCILCIVIGIIVSLITYKTTQYVDDPLLYIPIFDRLCCCLPRHARRQLACPGVFASDERSSSSSRKRKVVYILDDQVSPANVYLSDEPGSPMEKSRVARNAMEPAVTLLSYSSEKIALNGQTNGAIIGTGNHIVANGHDKLSTAATASEL
jgi:sodium-coupled monocarboxylate transporter 8/12